MIWRCPNCQAVFEKNNSGWRCQNGHSFDMAKQGYVNLLLANQKNSRDPGDNRDMVAGRRAFLQQGHYHPLVAAIASLLEPHLTRHPQAFDQTLQLLDLGCGEGYYVKALSDILPAVSDGNVSPNGLDISREAVKRAAKLLPNGNFCIGSSYRVPVADASVDIALQVFAPVADAELGRILAPSGVWLRVTPGPRHLYQLKAALYEQVREHDEPPVPEGFRLIAQTRPRFPLMLKGEASIANLLAMTPFGWHGSREGHRALVALNEFTTEADFLVQLMSLEEN